MSNQAWGVQSNGDGGEASVIITATKSEFLNLVNTSNLTFPATYKITDIENGLFLETLSENTFNPQGVLSLLIPDYTVAPQLVMGQSVTIGDLYSWGNLIWENTSGNNPDYVSQYELEATDWALVPKSLANDYVAIQLNVTWDATDDLFTSATQDATQNTYSVSAFYSSLFGFDAIQANSWRSINTQSSNICLNNVGDTFKNQVQVFGNFGEGGVSRNSGDETSTVQDNNIGAGCDIGSNELRNGSIYEANVLSNGGQIIKNFSVNSEIRENIINGSGQTNIGYNFQHDASLIQGNEITGDDVNIQAVQQNNNSELNFNILTGDRITIGGFSQLRFDKFNGNSFVGNDIIVGSITQNGDSEISGFDVQQNGWQMGNIEMSKAILKDFTYNTPKIIKNLYISNCTIEKGTNISIENLNCDTDLDLTGFTVDINGETIQSGKGWFTITHDFATSNLNAGSSALYNLIPISAKVTNIKAFGDATGGAGATLAFGIDTDAPNLIAPAVLATVNAGQIYNSLSATATANRSLAIAAGVANVTGGSVTVLVEFMI